VLPHERGAIDAEPRELIYEKHMLAETMISRLVMKGFKALIREREFFAGLAECAADAAPAFAPAQALSATRSGGRASKAGNSIVVISRRASSSARKVSTASGSNWLPDMRRISALATSKGRALR
jgi:hypothetical protein